MQKNAKKIKNVNSRGKKNLEKTDTLSLDLARALVPQHCYSKSNIWLSQSNPGKKISLGAVQVSHNSPSGGGGGQ